MARTARDITIPARICYVHLDSPHKASETAEPKYSVTALIPKTDHDTIAAITTAVQAAVKDGVERGTFKQPFDPAQTLYPPLRDGDTPTNSGDPRGPEFAGCWFISAKASTKRKPFVVDGNRQPIIDPAEVYSGCYANIAIQFYGYATSGNRGIAASLIGVQKVKDGDHLGGPELTANDVFTVITPTTQNSTDLGF